MRCIVTASERASEQNGFFSIFVAPELFNIVHTTWILFVPTFWATTCCWWWWCWWVCVSVGVSYKCLKRIANNWAEQILSSDEPKQRVYAVLYLFVLCWLYVVCITIYLVACILSFSICVAPCVCVWIYVCRRCWRLDSPSISPARSLSHSFFLSQRQQLSYIRI